VNTVFCRYGRSVSKFIFDRDPIAIGAWRVRRGLEIACILGWKRCDQRADFIDIASVIGAYMAQSV